MSTLTDLIAVVALGYVCGKAADLLASRVWHDGRFVDVTVSDREIAAFLGGAR